MSHVRGPSLSRAQIQTIARQEGASPDDVQEATRRMRKNPRVLRGEVRNQGAFFRGVLRGVLTDRGHGEPASTAAAPDVRPDPRPASPASPAAVPADVDPAFGHMCIRARSLLRAGATSCDVLTQLTAEFPDTGALELAGALACAMTIDRALGR